MMRQPYPWQHEPWARLCDQANQNRLPQGLLITGPEGVGKGDFAEAFGAWLLCAAPSSVGTCGDCPACHQLAVSAHPDFFRVEPEEKGKELRIDQVRGLSAALNLTAARGGRKVALLCPVDALTEGAANALLKTLEEPPPNTLMILVTARPGALPATVRSRCQHLVLPIPREEDSRPWLVAQGLAPEQAGHALGWSGGRPLRALQFGQVDAASARDAVLADLESLHGRHGDPVAVAGRWVKVGMEESVIWVQGLTADVIRLASGAGPPRAHGDRLERLQRLSSERDLRLLFAVNDACSRVRSAIERHHNLVPQGLMEQVAVAWYRSARRQGARQPRR